MLIGERLQALREHKNLSQGHIEQRTGLLRCYVSRVENGHTVPAVETLEKFARALDVPLYQLFYDGDESSNSSRSKQPTDDDGGWGGSGKDRRALDRFRRLLSRIDEHDRELLLSMAQQMVKPNGRRKSK